MITTTYINYVKVNVHNLRKLYDCHWGNLYFRSIGKKHYDVVDDWEFEDLYDALCYEQIEMIWIDGPSLGTEVEVEDN